MRQYLDLMQRILDEGVEQQDRTGTGTLSYFGAQMRFDLADGFPLLTTKKLHLRSIIVELLWFLRGDTNIRWLKERKVSIWDEWADENGDLGPVYGKQWRDWESRRRPPRRPDRQSGRPDPQDPYSRRQIVTAWNPGEIHRMALAPCHCLFQTQVADGRLNLQLYQRSADFFLGVPFNIASYALLTHMLARECGLEPGCSCGPAATSTSTRTISTRRGCSWRASRGRCRSWSSGPRPGSFGYEPEDFAFEAYDPHPHIAAPVAV